MSITSLIYKFLNKDINFLEQFLTELPAHLYCKNKDGIYLWCNHEQAKSIGLSSNKEVVGKTDFDLNENNIAHELRANDLIVINSGVKKTIEEKAIINGQEIIYLSQKIPLKNSNNEVIGILGISLDITERKNMESKLLMAKINAEIDSQTKTEFLEQLISELPANVYWKDPNGIILGCNDSNAKTSGFISGQDVIGKSDFDLLPNNPDLAEFSRKNDLRIIKTGIKETFEEKAIVNGKEKIYLSQKTPLRNKQKDIIGILGISIDITELKKAEQALLVSKEKAEAADKAKTEFLRNMRHDFRTPFSGILGMASILQEQEEDHHKKELLGDIANSAQILLEQLNEIADFIALEDGETPILEKQFDLHQVVTAIKRLLLPSAKNKNLNLSLTIENNLPQYIIGDKTRTSRILINLLTNSIKFTKDGEVSLSISVAKIEEQKIVIRFMVKDTGIGFSAKEKDLIFEKFSRLTPSYQGIYTGKGLGLRIVKQFLDEVGGEIHVKSKIDNGSTFVVLIPYKIPLLACNENELLDNDDF